MSTTTGMTMRRKKEAEKPPVEKKYRYRLIYDAYAEKPWTYELECDLGNGWSYSGWSWEGYKTDHEAALAADTQIARSKYRPKTYGWVEV